jgi:hypothetical protein
MRCPLCSSRTRVLRTITGRDNSTLRRRACRSCGHRLTTFEREHGRKPTPTDALVCTAIGQLAESLHITRDLAAVLSQNQP